MAGNDEKEMSNYKTQVPLTKLFQLCYLNFQKYEDMQKRIQHYIKAYNHKILRRNETIKSPSKHETFSQCWFNVGPAS